MGKGGKFNLNRNKKRRVKDKGSDDSDDDYVLEEDEESNGSEELCVVSDDDDEEVEEERFDFEAVGVSSDEEVEKQKVVKSKSKPKPRCANMVGDPLDWRQLSKKGSDDEEYRVLDDEDYEDEDEEFVPDENEKVVRSKVSKLKKNSLDRKRTRGRKPSKKTRVSDDDDEEEEYCDFDDEDYEDDDEEFMPDEKEMVVRSKTSILNDNSLGRKRTRVRKLIKKTSISDDEEEYHELEDEELDGIDKRERVGSDRKRTRDRHASKKTRVSDDEEEYRELEDEDDEEFAPDGIDKKGRVGLGRKRSRVRQTSKKTRVSDDEEEYRELEDEDDEEFAPAGIDKKGKVGLDRKRTRVKQPSKKTRVSDDEEDYQFDEDDEDDDEEFALDGIDFVDEEEDLEVEKKSKKATQHVSRKKVSVEGRKRKRKTKVSKKPSKKKQKGIFGVRKSGSSDDEDFVDTVRVVREKCRKNTRKRNKRMVTDWDSGSACSESSELEYTISEEEKESLEEAKKFCGEVKTSLRNSSPLKRSQVDGAPSCQQQKPVGRKGKATISDLQNDTGKQVCGICLTEEGNGIVRGTLNCCSHYFCFACIMEWSKVESRCPLCKQRFVRITKTPRSDIGIDLRTSVIQVPTRDQVYRPSEEEVRGYYDPYENVVCIECHQGGDDSLMLLCDICDSPAHTYCVGLQREVPEGNWYCEGCRVSEASSSNMQVQHPIVDHGSGNSSLPTSLSTTHRINSVDLVQSSQYSVSIPEPSFSHGFGNLQSPRYLVRDVHAPSPSGAGASTLSGRRRVHRQVHDRFSNNRENQMAVVVPRSTALSHIDLNCEANFEFEQFEERTHQAGTLLSNGFNSAVDDWGQDIGPLSLSLSHSGQVGSRGTNAAITSSSAHATLHSEHERTNLLLGSEQFQYCSIRSDDIISPRTYRQSSYSNGESAK